MSQVSWMLRVCKNDGKVVAIKDVKDVGTKKQAYRAALQLLPSGKGRIDRMLEGHGYIVFVN